ncbi:MAG: IS110 family transposase [Pseudomonadota bacterium]
MSEVSIVGLDLAKNAFQAHGARADGSVAFRKKLRRGQLLAVFASLPRSVVAMEACASARYWGREIGALGHEIRLIPPIYVKPFVKRQKNDAADAEAIAEAASRATMRFVAVKSAEKQAASMAFRTRDLLVRQRTQSINALRGHLAEFGVAAPAGRAHCRRLEEAVEDPATGLPDHVIELARLLIAQVDRLSEKIAILDREIRNRSQCDGVASRLATIPGVGPITAAAMEAIAPPPETVSKGRDFAAWLGLTPRQHSTGGKDRLGRTSKMGQRNLRRLLIIGAMAVLRWAARNGAPEGSWLARMMAKKPRMLVAVALANKTARVAWALMAKGGVYRNPAAA